MKTRHTILTTCLLTVCLSCNAQGKYPVLKTDSAEYAEQLHLLDYEPIEAAMNKEIETINKNNRRKRKLTAAQEATVKRCEAVLERCKAVEERLKGTDRLLIVDSMVVDKAEFLKAYRYSAEIGTIRTNNAGLTTEYETERGNRVYQVTAPTKKNPHYSLAYCIKEGGKLGAPHPLAGIDIDGDVNYPFMMADGATFYFAARSADGIGNYDLYVTRYNSDDDRFYRPENLGFPYNSYANDYLLVMDEAHDLGWFASDRYQPEGKVCIYTFVPNASRHTIDFENTNRAQLRGQASLLPIRSTWSPENQDERVTAHQRIVMLSMKETDKKPNDGFEFVVNDNYTYTSLSEFRSAEARTLCAEWAKNTEKEKLLSQELYRLRDIYASAKGTKKTELKQQIAELEQQVNTLRNDIKVQAKLIRKAELSH